MKRSLLRLVTVGVICAALMVVGCSKNQPCDTDPAQIEDARSELTSAQGELDSAKSELASAQGQKQDLEQQINTLPEKGEMEEHLDILKKGSGR